MESKFTSEEITRTLMKGIWSDEIIEKYIKGEISDEELEITGNTNSFGPGESDIRKHLFSHT